MPYITNAELKTSVVARMGTTDAQAVSMGGTAIDALIAEANESSYQKIREVMIGRGYSADQVDTWDGRVSWSKRVGACHYFRAASANKPVQGYIDPTSGICKCETELETATILISGVAVSMDSGLPDGGTMTNTDDDEALLNKIADEDWGQ